MPLVMLPLMLLFLSLFLLLSSLSQTAKTQDSIVDSEATTQAPPRMESHPSDETIAQLESQLKCSRSVTVFFEEQIRKRKAECNLTMYRLQRIAGMEFFPQDTTIIRRTMSYIEDLENKIRVREARLGHTTQG